ncbi:hypothetical protein H0264_18570 [Nocardia huaxiensis]|uniref:Uncharacterized protein n=1 Tax=Nocardia huaxiensis TaxID=2755382 RepID=A0A7D6ZU54_9NOCA|nr:hypothetical protein [Nocardia huaxiensis]QLY33965.1 hypothetical protein H0264_18570 [Nocardia huaxiensis]
MFDNRNEPILPIPSDLYDEIGHLGDRVQALRADITRIRHRYAELAQSPKSLRVDELGRPIDPREAVILTHQALRVIDRDLETVENGLRYAHGPASRISLTDTAAEHRNQQLAAQHPPVHRTR